MDLGFIRLLSGSMRVFGKFNYQGWYARLVGAIFMIPLPISLYLPRLLSELGVPSYDSRFYFILFEVVMLIIFIGGGILFGNYMARKRETSSPNFDG